MRIFATTVNAVALLLASVTCLLLTYFADAHYIEIGDVRMAILTLITILLLALIFVVETVSVFKIHDSSYHTVLMTLSLLLYSLFSPDALSLYIMLGSPIDVVWLNETMGQIAFLALTISLFHMLFFTYRPERRWGGVFSTAAVLIGAALSSIVYGVLSIYRLQIIGQLLFVLFAIVYWVMFAIRCIKENIDGLVFWLLSFVLFAGMGIHTANVLFYSGLVENTVVWTSAYLWAIMLCFTAVYLSFILKTERKAVVNEYFKREAETLKASVLVKQFTPHFVSNSLTVVKTAYHRDLEEGDRAIWLFSNYMRDTVGMLEEGLVPFEKELEFVGHYIDFVNFDREHPFHIVYDIDYSDFPVPALSLQPYVENAVKYSKVNLKEDGAITISSYKDEQNIYLKIRDNGVGFDGNSHKKGSAGIVNSSERFKILLNASTEVKSDGNGTEISITIPLRHEGEKI